MLHAHRGFPLTLLGLLLAGSPGLLGQVTTGSFSGVVKDAKGNPLQGAVVTLRSEALFSPRRMVTNVRGEWRDPMLPPGQYDLSASAPGYVGAGATQVRVGLGASARVDLVLKAIQVAQAEVEVTAASGNQVDKTETKASVNFSGEALLSLPTTNRSFEGALFLAPGVTEGATGSPNIRGGMSNSTLYRVDGTDIKNDYSGGRTGTGVLEDMIEDVQVVVSPLNARLGRTTGGAVNVVTRQGSNTFAGSVRANFSRPSWRATERSEWSSDLANENDTLAKELVFTLSGPVLRDRVWFSFATRHQPDEMQSAVMSSFTSKSGYDRPYLTGLSAVDALTLAGPSGFAFTKFDDRAPYTRMNTDRYYEGKVSVGLTSNHTVDLTVMRETNLSGSRGSSSYIQRAMMTDQLVRRKKWGLNYRGLLSSNAFLEARVNDYHSEDDWPKFFHPVIGDNIAVAIKDSSSSQREVFTNHYAPGAIEIRGNRSGAVNLKLFWEGIGQHDADFGLEYYTGRRKFADQNGPLHRRIYVGGVYVNPGGTDWRFPAIQWTGATAYKQSSSGTKGLAPVLRQYFGQDGETNTFTRSLYFNDAWTVNRHLNLMFGLRFDQNRIGDTTGDVLATNRTFSPRFQAKFDPTGEGRDVVTFSAAKFNDDFVTGFTSGFVTRADTEYSNVGWTGAALGQPLPGASNDPLGLAGVRFLSYADLVNLENWKRVDPVTGKKVFNTFATSSSRRFVIDPALRPPTSRELSLGYTRQLKDGKLSLTYVNRVWDAAIAVSQDYTPSQWVVATDPLGADVKLAMQTQRIFNSDALTRVYNGLEVDLQRSLSRVWSLQVSLGYSTTKGNDEGGDVAGDSAADRAPRDYFNQRAHLLGTLGVPEASFSPEGYLLAHQLFKARVSLVGRFPLGTKGGFLSYGWILQYATGNRFSAEDSAPLNMQALPPIAAGVINPTLPVTYSRFYAPRGAYGWNDHYTVRFKLAYEVPLGFGKTRFIGDVSVYNLLNHLIQTSWDGSFLGASSGSGYLQAYDPSTYGTTRPGTVDTAGYYRSPRSVSFSLGLKF